LLDADWQALDDLNPALRLSTVANWLPIRRAEDLAILLEGLGKAGLSD
jgi:hypothetical protein